MAKAAGKSKMDAVRDILSKHGKDTMPIEITKLAKSEHGVELSSAMASTYKTVVLKELSRGGKPKGKRGRKRGRKAALNGATSATSGVPKAVLKLSVEDIAAVKKLVDQIGAEKVEQLAKVLAK